MAASRAGGGEGETAAGRAATGLSAEIRQLREAVRARDEFLAIAAHELRNPITPIYGEVELLLGAARRDGAPPSVIRGLERLDRMISTYVRRTTVFLDVARITSGKLHCAVEPVDLTQLVLDLAHALAPAARRAGCHLETGVEEQVSVLADRVSIEQIVENLVINALKYGAGRPVDLTLATAPGSARIAVRDEGPGIAPDDQVRIFGKFERAVGRRARQGGFGIGLWISNQLAAAMGGSL